MGANSGAKSFNSLFEMLSGPTALATLREANDLYTLPKDQKINCECILYNPVNCLN